MTWRVEQLLSGGAWPGSNFMFTVHSAHLPHPRGFFPPKSFFRNTVNLRRFCSKPYFQGRPVGTPSQGGSQRWPACRHTCQTCLFIRGSAGSAGVWDPLAVISLADLSPEASLLAWDLPSPLSYLDGSGPWTEREAALQVTFSGLRTWALYWDKPQFSFPVSPCTSCCHHPQHI